MDLLVLEYVNYGHVDWMYFINVKKIYNWRTKGGMNIFFIKIKNKIEIKIKIQYGVQDGR